ncbi:MAG: haloacid dehalogenase [Chloroflexaceae bacterium]|nr:haloacid dehalogenase [Chloroflexaceae bacterium]
MSLETAKPTALEALVSPCQAMLERRHGAREQALNLARSLTRQCANTIRAAHRAQFDEAARLLTEAGAEATRLREAVANYPDLLAAGYTQDAFKEYAEASLVWAFLVGSELPSAHHLAVEPAAYLNGLAEAASELRRAILDRLRRGSFDQVEPFLATMDEVYSLLLTVDYPDALTGGLRRSTDALRLVLERTRGDVTAALRQEHLTAALAALEARLDQAEQDRSRIE